MWIMFSDHTKLAKTSNKNLGNTQITSDGRSKGSKYHDHRMKDKILIWPMEYSPDWLTASMQSHSKS